MASPVITDEAGMCIIDIGQVKQRLEYMDSDEKDAVRKISGRYLANLVRMAHCPDLASLSGSVADLTDLIVNFILNTTQRDVFKTFKDDDFVSKRRQGELKTLQNIPNNRENIHKLMGSIIESVAATAFNSSTILSFISLNFGGGAGNTNSCVQKLLSMLKNYNPLYIEEVIWLNKCSNHPKCSCHALKKMLDDGSAQPVEMLMSFFLCMNHKRRLYGAGLDAIYEQAIPNVTKLYKDPNVIRFPFREVMMAAIFGTGFNIFGDQHYRTSPETSELWMTILLDRIAEMSLEDRAFMCMVYSFMFFSRYSNFTADSINSIFYLIITRFILKSTETLFCIQENSSRLSDGGQFLKYMAGLIPTVVMSNPLIVEKAYNEWRNGNVPVTAILSLVHNKWRHDFVNGVDDLHKASTCFSSKITEMANNSQYVKRLNNNKPVGLGSSRSKRYIEHYLPYGSIKVRGPITAPTSVMFNSSNLLGLSKNFSNGRNLPCNVFSVLPELPPLAPLGRHGKGDQTRFEDAAFQGFGGKLNQVSFGRFLGFLTALIDRHFISRLQQQSQESGEAERRMITDAINECIFNKVNNVSEFVLNNVTELPESRSIDTLPFSREVMGVVGLRNGVALMPWQRPAVESPNISALSISQLELTMSKDPNWAKVMSEFFFFIERIDYQITHQIIKTMYSRGEQNEDVIVRAVTDKASILMSFDEAITTVKTMWIQGGCLDDDDSDANRVKTGNKRSFNENGAKHHNQWEGPAILQGKHAFNSIKLYNCLRSICIDNDWNPSVIIGYSDFLVNYTANLDDFVNTISASLDASR